MQDHKEDETLPDTPKVPTVKDMNQMLVDAVAKQRKDHELKQRVFRPSPLSMAVHRGLRNMNENLK